MWLLGQIDAGANIVDSASQHSWEAALLASLVLGGFGFLGWMLKRTLATGEARETRMASRIDALENQIASMHTEHNANTAKMSRLVTEAIVQSTETMRAMNATLQGLSASTQQVNGDLKEMCSLLKMCPCLMVGMNRGDYRIVDRDGKEVHTTHKTAEG